MNISVKTSLSKGRVETWYKFHMMKMDDSRFLHYIALMLMVIGMFLFATWLGDLKYSTHAFVILILCFIVLIASRPYRIHRAYKKVITKNPLEVKSFTVTFNDEGVVSEMDNSIQKFTWDKIVTVREIVDCYFVYVSVTKAIIIPKFLMEKAEREQLVEVFKSKTFYKKHNFGQIAGD